MASYADAATQYFKDRERPTSPSRSTTQPLDWRLIAPDRWIAEFQSTGFELAVHDLKQNAIRALRLAA